MFPFLWIGFAIAVGVWASNRGRHGFGWFLIACAISPILAGVFLAVIQNNAQFRCWQCAEFVLKQARKCKHCDAELSPSFNYQDKSQIKQVGRKLLVTDIVMIVILGILLINLIYFETK